MKIKLKKTCLVNSLENDLKKGFRSKRGIKIILRSKEGKTTNKPATNNLKSYTNNSETY